MSQDVLVEKFWPSATHSLVSGDGEVEVSVQFVFVFVSFLYFYFICIRKFRDIVGGCQVREGFKNPSYGKIPLRGRGGGGGRGTPLFR